MEIKKGDKVRVSKDAPKLIFGGCDMSQIVCTVCCVDKDVAAISMTNDKRTEMKVWIVPTKYLVKVDTEAKEPKRIFYGDYAKEAGQSLENLKRKAHPEWYSSTEPAEQTEVEIDVNEELQEIYTPFSLADRIERNYILHRMRVFSQDDFVKEINPAEHEVTTKPHYVPKIMFNTEFWVKYEADLAKELAISYAKRGKSPLDAVAAAKEITKRLKQK